MKLKNNADHITQAGFGEAIEAFANIDEILGDEVMHDILHAVAGTIEDRSERSRLIFDRITGFIIGYEVRRREERK